MEPIEQLLVAVSVLLGLILLVVFLKKRGYAQFNLSAPGRRGKNMEVVERLSLTAQHSLHLVRVNGDLLLVSVSPTVCNLLKSDMPAPRQFSQESTQ